MVSAKNGVRYRFYVSSALLRGQKGEAGAVGRVSATEIEGAVRAAIVAQRGNGPKGPTCSPDPIERVERVVVAQDQLSITLMRSDDIGDIDDTNSEIRIPWSSNKTSPPRTVESGGENDASTSHNEGLIQSIVRAHAWKRALLDAEYDSVETLAETNRLHPKVVRQALRLAFLSPDVSSAILEGRQPKGLSLAQIPKLLPLSVSALRVATVLSSSDNADVARSSVAPFRNDRTLPLASVNSVLN
jgi:site-specific DNA recombinase